MNELSRYALASALETFKARNCAACIVSEKAVFEIEDYDFALKMNIGDAYYIYVWANPHINPELSKSFATPYIIVHKVFDENKNVFLIADEQPPFDI